MIKHLCSIRDAIVRLRTQLRFGKLSRAPLQLLRLEWRGDHVACDWIARAPDEWDKTLPLHVGERNASVQALEDALAVRELLFWTMPEVLSVTFRVYRRASEEPELVIMGTAMRSEPVQWDVSSLAMRAKFCGFQFCLNDGKLVALQAESSEMLSPDLLT